MATRRGAFTLESIDDYLGPAAGRFFGSGYRRVEYRFEELAFGTGADVGRLEATVGIGYPRDWSTKATTHPIRPHLSTVDALVLGARLSALALTAVPDLDEESRRTAWLRRMVIHASVTPVEDGLDALPVSAELRSTSPEGEGAASVVACRVGPMKVQCELVHPRPTGAGRRPGPAELIASTQDGPYGLAIHGQRQQIEQVAVADGRANALVSVTPLEALSPAPLVSLVDAFVVSLQLGQVLLYELDGVERARSSNLWMRSTTLTGSGPHRAADGPAVATASLAGPRLIDARGATWRAASIVGDSFGLRTRCSVAHQLPATGRLASAPAA